MSAVERAAPAPKPVPVGPKWPVGRILRTWFLGLSGDVPNRGKQIFYLLFFILGFSFEYFWYYWLL